MLGRPTFLLGWPIFTGYVSVFRCFSECNSIFLLGKTARDSQVLMAVTNTCVLKWLLLVFLPFGRTIRSHL